MNSSIIRSLSLLTLVGTFASCTHTPPEQPPVPRNYQNGTYVVMEGGFGNGNASISYIHSNGDSLVNDVYTLVNDLPLGDIHHSMNTRGDKGYLVVNNSAKIEVVNLEDFTSAGTINDLGTPRFIEFISDTKAYVTDLYAGSIYIVDPSSYTKTGTISINGGCEELRLIDGMIYAVGNASGQLYKIDPNTDAVVDSVAVGTSPGSMEVDSNGKVWVLTSGGWQQDIPNLVRINPATMMVEADLAFNNTDESPSELAITPDGMNLLYLNTDLYSMSIGDAAIPGAAFIEAGNNGFYKMDVHPSSGEIYISDAVDFVQNGKVYKYDSAGTMQATYDVGIIPGSYHFIGD